MRKGGTRPQSVWQIAFLGESPLWREDNRV